MTLLQACRWFDFKGKQVNKLSPKNQTWQRSREVLKFRDLDVVFFSYIPGQLRFGSTVWPDPFHYLHLKDPHDGEQVDGKGCMHTLTVSLDCGHGERD